MSRVPLIRIAHGRSGDKGDTVNVGVIARREGLYPVIAREVTAERVQQHFGDMVKGRVERFELPNVWALNFLLHQALDGGGTVSLMTDAQGKTFSTALLRRVSSAEHITTLLLNRPEKRNALDELTMRELAAALRVAASDEAVRVIVLRGAGPDFCAGADLTHLGQLGAA
jgi:hypothetical protein